MMKAMILAAGRGKRMRELTDHCPKPLLKVGDDPLIVWQIKRLAAAGFRDVVINLGYKGEMIRTALGTGRQWGVEIQYSREPEEGLETAGGIIQALPLLGERPFLVVNADVWHSLDFGTFPAQPLNDDHLAHLVLVKTPTWKAKGDFSLENHAVTAGKDLTFAGISILHPRLFAGVEPGFKPLAPILQKYITRRAVSGELFSGEWHDIGTPERLAEIQRRHA